MVDIVQKPRDFVGFIRVRPIISNDTVMTGFVIEEVNETFLSMTQLPLSSLLGKSNAQLPPLIPFDTVDWMNVLNLARASTRYQATYQTSIDASVFQVDAFCGNQGIINILVTLFPREEIVTFRQGKTIRTFTTCQLWNLVDQHLPSGMWLKDEQGNVIVQNKWLKERMILTPEQQNLAIQTDQEALSTMKTLIFNENIHFTDGSDRTLRVIKEPFIDPTTNEKFVLGVGYDFTNEIRIAKELATSEAQFRFIAENAQDVIWIFNVNSNRFTYFSPSIMQLTGYRVDEALNLTVRQLLAHESAERVKQLFQVRTPQFAHSGDTPMELVEVQFTSKAGTLIWTESSARMRRNNLGEIEVIGVSRNIEARKQAEHQMDYLSHHDHLTDVYNRRYFESKGSDLMSPDHYPLTFIVADLNGLKLANDAFGHLHGDLLLQRFADLLKENTRREDLVARLGGDEFAIILPQTHEKGAQVFLKRLRTRLESTKVGPLVLSASFGAVTVEQPGTPLNELYHAADEKMYLQKIIDGSKFKKELVNTIADHLYSKYPVERLHGEKVAQWSALIAKALGLDNEVVKAIEKIGFYHDIGRVALPDKYNGEKLEVEDEDISAIRRLPEVGYHILKASEEFSSYAEIVLYHHENMDGSGYPKGMKGDEIPLPSRIVKVANMYDTMVRFEGFTVQETIRHLQNKSGKVYDSSVIEVFLYRVLKLSI